MAAGEDHGHMRIGTDIFFISMAAERLGMHPQTLRKYERLGLIRPTRTIGSMRVYSRDEIERLRLIKHLVDEAGVNLAGVQRLLSIADVVRRMRAVASSNGSTRTQMRRLAEELERLSQLLEL
jgi:MerR family transcriptional regulator/heat shock protein HspR